MIFIYIINEIILINDFQTHFFKNTVKNNNQEVTNKINYIKIIEI